MAHNIPKIIYGDSDTEISFDYPPLGDDGDLLNSKAHVSESISGMRQVSIDYIAVERDLKFTFLSETIKAQLYTFFALHALYGKSFKYFDDKNGVDFVFYELDTLKFTPKRMQGVGENAYIWELPLKLRRVLGFVSEDIQVINILNNQAAAVNLTGVVFDATKYSAAKITAELRRKTATQEVACIATINIIYNALAATWGIDSQFDGDACGVVFSINNAGQIKYTSDDLTGSGYIGTFKPKESTFTA